MTEVYQQTNATTPPSAASLMDYLDPQKEIEPIKLELEGLQKVERILAGKRVVEYYRVNRPMFTHEFIRTLIRDLKVLVNLTVQVSRAEKNRVFHNIGSYAIALKSSLALQGDDNYISEDTWSRIIEIHEAFVEVDGKRVSGWSKFGVDWDYNKSVSYEMRKYGVKDFNEEVDQKIEFILFIRSLTPFLEGSLFKSFSGERDAMGMLLRSMSEIRTETQTFRENDKKTGLGVFSPRTKSSPTEWQ